MLGSPDAIQPVHGRSTLAGGRPRVRPEASRSPHSSIVHESPTTLITRYAAAVIPSSAMTNSSCRPPAVPSPASRRLLTIACLMRSTSRSMWNRNGLARTRPMAAIASRSRSSPPRTRVIGAPCRDDSVTVSTRSVVGTISKPSGRGDDACRRSEEERKVRAIARGVFQELLYERVSVIAAVVIRSAVEHGSDPADAHGLPIQLPRQVVPLGAGEHVVALHQRESAPMTERPRGLPLSRVVLCERVATQAAIRGQRRCSGHALEDGSLRRNHPGHSVLCSEGGYGRKAALFVVRSLSRASAASAISLFRSSSSRRGASMVSSRPASRIALCARVLNAFDTRTS